MITQEAFITTLEAKLNSVYTEEQRELIRNFNKAVICFASPGTGKTHTAIAGLINAELFMGIPGENIYALSFTKMATGELSVRHREVCKKLGCSQTVNFQTLHSLCATIVKENAHYFKLKDIQFQEKRPLKDAVQLISDLCTEWGEKMTPQKARNIAMACETLNSALIFDSDNVKSKSVFKKAHCDYELFTKIRYNLFLSPIYTGIVPVDSIMLYALALMTRHPEVSEDFKSKCKLMLVDEAQDLSLLHLRIISMLADNPILIGDMKQQIYGFNGACQEIVQRFYELYPNAETKELTQSFRCKNEVVEFANKIIVPNNITGGPAKGTGDGGSVKLISKMPLEELAQKFHDDYFDNKRLFTRDVMFLFRNNASAFPIVEELFKQEVPFRVNNYEPATAMPVLKEMVEILNLCRNPYNINYVYALGYLIPELRGYASPKDNPFYKQCEKCSCSVFEVNYVFKDLGIGSQAMSLLLELSDMIKSGSTVTDLLNRLWGMYEAQWLHQRAWMLRYPVNYYLNIISPITRDKTFDKFMSDEAAKASFVKENVRAGRGIRCYTMHASKGLEADDVYILDADPGIIPNDKKLSESIEAGSSMDAAREVRNERSLCYVAVTRARENVFISSLGEPAPMLLGNNTYEHLDSLYKACNIVSDDITAFNEFVGDFI